MLKSVQKVINTFKSHFDANAKQPMFALVEILNTNDQHIAVIKMKNRNLIFQAKPEEVLANDDLVDLFSPRDIRTLTYLGYLGIHSPQYKILAQDLYQQQDKTIFTLQKKGDKTRLTKSADEILQESHILKNLSSQDAKTIGYALGTESVLAENKLKQSLLASENDDK